MAQCSQAMADGMVGAESTQQEIWMAQLANAQQAIDASEERNQALREELRDMAQRLPSALA
jgi:truncated hemoglobin YjbI